LKMLLLPPAMSPRFCCRPPLRLGSGCYHANLLLLVRTPLVDSERCWWV
jgi:hypothetical protein